MASLRRVDIRWTGLAGSPFFTQLFFDWKASQANATVTALTPFFNTLRGYVYTGLTATLDTAQTIVDVGTGNPTGVEIATTAGVFAGSGVGPFHPPATQGLLRLKTDMYIGARRLTGRMYLPSMITLSGAGTPSTAFKTAMDAAGTALITATATPGQWSVLSKTHHAAASISSVSTWDQWAVMRSRRD